MDTDINPQRAAYKKIRAYPRLKIRGIRVLIKTRADPHLKDRTRMRDGTRITRMLRNADAKD